MAAHEVTIRRVEPRDAAAIARLWQELSDYHVGLDERMPRPTRGSAQRYAERLLQRRDDPDTRTLVAEVDGEVVGYILGAVIDLQPDLFAHQDTGFIADLYVDPAHRRQGIARELVETLNAWFERRGVRQIELQVASANPDAIAFWEAVGSRPITIRMRLSLD